MKPTIHPDYQSVVFRDASADFSFLTRSTRTSDKTVTWEDGHDYPVIDVEVSSASHPFYTGKATVLDTAGRVERFRRRYGQSARAGATTAPASRPDAAADAASESAAGPDEAGTR
ncbi:type B 50S ribosomal protein L31 [Brachybacterium alimentarium]|nr:type B 50S ribosomal protein L31 [Brachybacterium alimentarium]RCS77098.1 type B 50S ribosomal protein L31 [Brachybacterium alimentarium]